MTAKPPLIYLIGSLRNRIVPLVGDELRKAGFRVFDDWYAAGPTADDYWQAFEQGRGRTYLEALYGPAAVHTFEFDKRYLERSSACVLALPAGRSAHLELGWMLGRGKPGYVLLNGPERWDVMYQFATGVFDSMEPLIARLNRDLIDRGRTYGSE